MSKSKAAKEEGNNFPIVELINSGFVIDAWSKLILPDSCVNTRVDLQACRSWAHKNNIPDGEIYGLRITRKK